MDNDATPPSLADIQSRLETLRPEEAPATAESDEAAKRGMGFGFRIGTEMVSAVVVGFGLGYALDHWLNTKPLFLMIGLLLGAAAGFMNVYRVVKGLDAAVGLGRALEAKKALDAKVALAATVDVDEKT